LGRESLRTVQLVKERRPDGPHCYAKEPEVHRYYKPGELKSNGKERRLKAKSEGLARRRAGLQEKKNPNTKKTAEVQKKKKAYRRKKPAGTGERPSPANTNKNTKNITSAGTKNRKHVPGKEKSTRRGGTSSGKTEKTEEKGKPEKGAYYAPRKRKKKNGHI